MDKTFLLVLGVVIMIFYAVKATGKPTFFAKMITRDVIIAFVIFGILFCLYNIFHI